MSKRKIYLLALLLIFSSCLKTDRVEIEKRVESLYQVTNFNKWVIRGSDSLKINELKFLIDDFSIITTDSVVLQKSENVPPLIYGYYEATGGDQLVFSVGLGFGKLKGFEKYNVLVTPADRQQPVTDSDFFDNDNSYSVVIKGRYNSSDFTFRSKLNRTKNFVLIPVVVDDKNNVLVINSYIDIVDLFVAEPDTIINPIIDSNINLISNQFIEALEVQFSNRSSILF